MKTNRLIALLVLTFLTLNPQLSTLFAQGTAFTYQGRLNDGANPANGIYDLRFTIYDASSGGIVVAGPVTNSPTVVGNGLFTVTLDFGAGVFTGARRWLEITARTNGGASFVTLSPRQQLTPTPYAIHSANALNAAVAATASSVSAANVSGVLSTAQLPAGLVTNGARGVNFSGTFTGNGLGMTNVPVSALVRPLSPVVLWGATNRGLDTLPPGVNGVAAISLGTTHNLLLRSNGTVVAWGLGTVYDPTNGFEYGQSMVPPGLSNVVAVSPGYVHSLALKSDGTVVAWGAGTANATNNFDLGQSIVPPGLSNVVAISGRYLASAALRTDGTVVAWGDNTYGETNVPAGLNGVMAISAAPHTLALKTNGTVVAWGLGMTNDPSSGNFGQAIVPPGLSNVVAVSAGLVHSLALKADGTTVAWGAGTANGTNASFEFGQSIVPPGLSNVVAIAAGFFHSLALKADGTVVAWGANPAFEAIYGTNIGLAIVPPGLGGVVAISAGAINNAALITAQWAPAQIPLLTGNNVFQGSIAATSFSGDGSGLANLNASQLTGTLPGSALSGTYTDEVHFVNALNSFTGDGSQLGALNASALTDGTVPDARLSTNVALRVGGNAFTENQTVMGGNVGIGTTDPPRRLTVQTGSEDYGIEHTDGTKRLSTFLGSGGAWLGTVSADPLYFFVKDGGVSMAVQTNGNVGIGTAFPTSRLHVIGDVRSSGQFIGNGAGLSGINASNIGSGTVADVRLSTNVAMLSAGKLSDSVLSANVALRNVVNNFIGNQNFTGGGSIITLDHAVDIYAKNASGVPEGLLTGRWADNGTYLTYGSGGFIVRNNAGTFAMKIENGGNVGIGTASPQQKLHVIGNILASGTITGSSDRNRKERFAPVNPADILERVTTLPIQQWNYIGESTPHVGPMAQDFHAAFGVGIDDKTISMVDADGVALAAIQGLNEKVKNATAALRAENAELKARLEKLENLLSEKSAK